jgi:hypothetical protein
MSNAATNENVVRLSVAYQAKQEKRKAEAGDLIFEAGDLIFEICRIIMMPERDRVRWVRESEKHFGFSILERSPAKKKKSTLKLVK